MSLDIRRPVSGMSLAVWPVSDVSGLDLAIPACMHGVHAPTADKVRADALDAEAGDLLAAAQHAGLAATRVRLLPARVQRAAPSPGSRAPDTGEPLSQLASTVPRGPARSSLPVLRRPPG